MLKKLKMQDLNITASVKTVKAIGFAKTEIMYKLNIFKEIIYG